SMKLTTLRQISPVYNLFNLKYLVIDSNRKFDIPGYYEVYRDEVLSILKNEYARNRVYLPRHIKIVNEEDEALRGVFELPSISGEQIIIERDSVAELPFDYESLLHRNDPDETVVIIAYSSNRFELRVRLASDGWVTLADTFYPGWKATIDGQSEAIIVPANYIFRAIYVPKGLHKIVFQYKPKYFSVSIMVALITLLGSCIAIFYRYPNFSSKFR
ncbi:MAG: YfhO family protein, partial [Deltaproteobacteria bacterium]|nr:YfhO family protein [Deltaproteobacteria bacterium]